MSVAEVQARIAELNARIATALTTPPALGARSFAQQLAGQMAGVGGRLGAGPVAAAGLESPDLIGTIDGNATGGADPAFGPDRSDGAAIVASAKQYLGVPYAWGGESPDGFDCSGLIQYVFHQHGVDLPRVAADQARVGIPVAPENLQAGDLVFFGSPVDHAGIYAGDAKMIVAPHRGAAVRVQNLDFGAVTAARRVLTTPADAYPAGSSWLDRLPPAGRPYAGAIARAASDAGVDPALVAAVARRESGFRPDAASGAGALGLMQLMPATARGLGVDPLDPEQNLTGGARYLASLVARFGRVDHAIAAYNAGPTAVARAGGIPPYGETQAYVGRVLDELRRLHA